MRDLSFVIPVRIDTDDRARNLEVVLDFLSREFPETEILVVESSPSPVVADRWSGRGLVRVLVDREQGRFSRARSANLGILAASRRFVAVYDADVLLEPAAIESALHLLRTGLVKAVLPFNWIFADVKGELAERIATARAPRPFGRITRTRHAPNVPGLSLRVVKGGVLLADRDVLRLEGGLNKKMVSYGWEDVEVIRRLTKLGYRVFSLPSFNLVHLDHERGPDSVSNERYEVNRAEYRKVTAMNRADLERYVETEIGIVGPGAEQARARLRRRQRLVNVVTLQPALHLGNQAWVAWHAYGFRELASTALRGIIGRFRRR